jgi:hypothetical protein
MLAHTTHAAPAAVLGASLGALNSGTAAASILSRTKGAINMMTMIKVKWLAAATILVLAIPLGVAVVLAQARAPAAPPVAAVPATQPAQPPATAPAVQVRVVDEQNRPVAGAEIYVVQTLMPTQRQEDMTFAGAGPVFADTNGAAKIAGLPASTPDQMGWQQTFFARVPGKKAGSGRRIFVRNAPPGMPHGCCHDSPRRQLTRIRARDPARRHSASGRASEPALLHSQLQRRLVANGGGYGSF